MHHLEKEILLQTHNSNFLSNKVLIALECYHSQSLDQLEWSSTKTKHKVITFAMIISLV